MPQAIPELREKILALARKRMLHNPPIPFTMREISRSCGAAIGTAYNYFSSKEELMATVMLADWEIALKAMNTAATKSETVLDAISDIYKALQHFCELYGPTFRCHAQQVSPVGILQEHHDKLVAQIAEPVRTALVRFDRLFDEKAPEALTELLLYASYRDKNLETLWPLIVKLLS